MSLGLVLLMAGTSSRMGCDKRKLPWQGSILGKVVLDLWQEALPECNKILVLPEEDPLAAHALTLGYRLVYNNCPQEGQASSIRLGLASLLQERVADLEGIIFSVGDQPLLDRDTIKCLIGAFKEAYVKDDKVILRPSYEPGGQGGNPVIFSAQWAEELASLRGDQGGRTLLQGAAKNHLVSVSIPSYHGWSRGFDVDTPEAYEKVYRTWGQENH